MRRLLAGVLLGWLLDTAYAASPPPDVGALKEGHDNGGFAHAREVRPFEFPRDHGPHPEFRHEWWYVTGHLQSAAGDRFGFELTFFRYALAPPQRVSAGPGAESRWRARQIYMAHFAITDIGRKEFHFAERYARAAVDLAGAQAIPFRVWLEDWSISETQSRWQLHAADDKYTLNVDLRPLLAPVLNGEQGLSRKSSTSDAASYYYSIPRMAVSGRIMRAGQSIAVNGSAWLDREWGSGALGIEDEGWDWFAFQLDDQSTLMFYALRNRKGGRDPNSAGTWVSADGSIRRLTDKDVELEVQSYWTSPRGGRYPARWRVRVPALDFSVDVRPVLADQELDTRHRYWEGVVEVNGTRSGRPVRGNGYVELVGYAETN